VNIFAVIEKLDEFSFKQVQYYSVKFEGDEYNEFEKFLIKHKDNESVQEELDDLLSWLEKLGDEIGAKLEYFRQEQKAHALPPNARYLEIKYKHNLRLYCMRYDGNNVILFNGGIKSSHAKTAQVCSVVGPKFRQANDIVRELEKMNITNPNDLDGLEIEL
jgi:hypothetical protein